VLGRDFLWTERAIYRALIDSATQLTRMDLSKALHINLKVINAINIEAESEYPTENLNKYIVTFED
jgi:hypothetical protein